MCCVPSPDLTVLVNPRQEIERKDALRYSERQSRAGKAGAESRLKSKGADLTADLTADQPMCNPGSAIQRQIQIQIQRQTEKEDKHCAPDGARCADAQLELTQPEAKPERVDEVGVWFSEFWQLYPRKTAKPLALKAARRHAKTAADRKAILECLRRRLPAIQEQFRADGDYRPYPASWLNQRPWDDPVEADRPAESKTAGGGSNAIDEAMRLYESKVSE